MTEPATALAPPAARPAPPPRPPAFLPRSMAELMELARAMYNGGVTPGDVDRAEKLVPILLAGMEIGLGPMQAVESIYMTNGRATLFGDVGKALILSSGLLEYQRDAVEGDGDDRKAVVTIKRAGQLEVCVEYTMAQAERLVSYQKQHAKNTGPWVADASNMLTWRARWKAWRSEFPDVLRGMTGYEEAEEPAVTVEATVRQEAPAPAPRPAAPPPAAVTDRRTEQLRELARLRGLLMASKGPLSPEEAAAAWAEVLTPFGVASARELTDGQLGVLVGQLGRQQDPFAYPVPAALPPAPAQEPF